MDISVHDITIEFAKYGESLKIEGVVWELEMTTMKFFSS